MTRKEAFETKEGDKVIYKEYYAFIVKGIKLTTPNDLERTGISFLDKNNVSYNYKYCRKWVNKCQ